MFFQDILKVFIILTEKVIVYWLKGRIMYLEVSIQYQTFSQ